MQNLQAATENGQFDLAVFLKQNILILFGLLALVIPTIYSLSIGLWQTDDQAHGPIILAIVLWLFWQVKDQLFELENKPQLFAAFWVIIPALLAYILGRSQAILMLEIGSFIPLVIGLLLLNKGWRAISVGWFALVFMLFLIPLPGFVVDALTGALKGQVSHIAEVVLYAAGYPVARSGVLITVGQYQLLVADACSGMHSMFSLLAVGSLYVFITNHSNRIRNTLLILAILPMAFAANIIRVMTLILVTFHFGDAAGQGFIHDFAGMALFAIALIGMFLLDALLGVFMRNKAEKK
ncbi:exosortase B [Chitinibacter bivalviorum]|uniref:Exosortase B n=1 Tax=Chitinibacter bivalviorum TaxID=2739434 RepID=A0A7H9BJN1_9NEIS|nr:exosortase B [Chitinibacter bivalviorum]QLG88221.1 exosortase B [Chitinibacter bivalviorum]